MELKVNGHIYKLYNEVNISLKYDSISDLFSYRLYFDPNNPQHKADFRPGIFPTCTITHGGVLVMTGTILKYSFASAGDPPKQLVIISGYSITGVLDDCCVLNTNSMEGAGSKVIDINSTTIAIPPASLQFDGLNLPQIASLVIGYYVLNLKIDPELANDPDFTKPYPHVAIDDDITHTKPGQKVSEFLNDLCKEKSVVLSHDRHGNVLLTRAHVDKIVTTSSTTVSITSNDTPGIGRGEFTTTTQTSVKTTSASRPVLHHFEDNDPVLNKTQRKDATWLGINLDFNGQALHRVLQSVGQKNGKEDNALDSAITNPFVAKGVDRYTRIAQNYGDATDTPDTVRSLLGDELKGIILTIDIQGWTLGGNLVVPNQLVTVISPENYLYHKTTWFIQEVDFYGDEKMETATLTCVIPACFGNDPVVNNYF